MHKWFKYFELCGIKDIKSPGLNDLILGVNFIVFDEVYKNLNDEELKDMFSTKENNMPKTNPFNAKNFGELIYKRKTSSDFSIEMDRCIRENIKCFIDKK